MSDADKTKPAAETTETAAPNRAKIGQDDYGKIVTSAAGEPFSGTISDITDGDTHHVKKKHK